MGDSFGFGYDQSLHKEARLAEQDQIKDIIIEAAGLGELESK